MHSRANFDPLFRPHHMPDVADFYCGRHELRDPRISPVFANLDGLPQTLIQVGDHEILLSDSTRIAENFRAAGVPVTLDVWPDMWHVFQFFVGFMPEATRAVNILGGFVRSSLRVPAAR
ncbi:MAG: alpha/beta hydrolase, partial [Woeseia sp.]|nr:alpha/beta hydrolase [Woeseia sp.]